MHRALKRDMGDLITDFNDTNVFGFTADETPPHCRFRATAAGREMLVDSCGTRGSTKPACLKMIQEAGIALPAMYGLGFEHNNCMGCVKSRSPKYWNLTRKHFPAVFARRAEQERELGFQIIRGTWLDELPPTTQAAQTSISSAARSARWRPPASEKTTDEKTGSDPEHWRLLPEITKLTLPFMKTWRKKIGAEFTFSTSGG